MFQTYQAILRAGQLEWGVDGPPAIPMDAAVPVQVTILVATTGLSGMGAARLAALEAAAAAGAADVFGDPVEWQREQRIDRVLFGREE